MNLLVKTWLKDDRMDESSFQTLKARLYVEKKEEEGVKKKPEWRMRRMEEKRRKQL